MSGKPGEPLNGPLNGPLRVPARADNAMEIVRMPGGVSHQLDHETKRVADSPGGSATGGLGGSVGGRFVTSSSDPSCLRRVSDGSPDKRQDDELEFVSTSVSTDSLTYGCPGRRAREAAGQVATVAAPVVMEVPDEWDEEAPQALPRTDNNPTTTASLSDLPTGGLRTAQ